MEYSPENSRSDKAAIRSEIVDRFNLFVRGQAPDLRGFNFEHDGAEGDWLTKRMGLTVNGHNEPDFLGYEMKKDSAKTTFGDWSPDGAVYLSPSKGEPPDLQRDEFLRIFGTAKNNSDRRKNGRYSWSGNVFPTVKAVNQFGQIMKVEDSGDIRILYDFSADQRSDKASIIPIRHQQSEVELARWIAGSLQGKLERKFNQLGWFRCIKNPQGVYTDIQFGAPVNYATFLTLVKDGTIFCDCGMHEGNARPYMPWRASRRIWDTLVES